MVVGIFILQVFYNVIFVSSSGGQEGKMSHYGWPLLKSNSCLVTETGHLKMPYQIKPILPLCLPCENLWLRPKVLKSFQNIT
jgi:hypothetical protein